MKKTRVLVALSGLSAGGAETMFINLYRKIDKARFQIDFLIFGSENAFYSEEVRAEGSKIFRMQPIQEGGIKGFCRSVEKCLIENGPYDVVHSHVDYLSGYIMKVAKKCGVKVRLAHSHSSSSFTHLGTIPKLFLFYVHKKIKLYSTHFLACSYEAAEYMFGKAQARKAVIINNAIDLDSFSDKGQFSEELNGLKINNKKVVLHIGRFVEPKNHQELIYIFNEYIKKNKESVLLLVGEGELKTDVEKLVESLGIQQNVMFLGARSDIPRLFSLADVFVLPSKFEGVPVTLIEAQAMNVPCVVSDNVGRAVDCGLGLISFVSLGDRKNWSLAIDKSISERKRKNNAIVMTNKGYNISENVDIIERVYSIT